VTLALEGSKAGLPRVRSNHLLYAAPKATRTFLTSKQVGSEAQIVGPVDMSFMAGKW
jgi:hypothetical protein